MKTTPIENPGFTPEEIALQKQGDKEFTEQLKRETYDPKTKVTERLIPIMHNPELPWFPDTKYGMDMKSGVHGSFAQSLYQAWVNAGPSNRQTLVKAFPNYFDQLTTKCY